jgi:hypothetical protein
MSASLIITVLAVLGSAALIGHMLYLETQDRRDHRRFIKNLRRINNTYPVYNDRNEIIGSGR